MAGDGRDEEISCGLPAQDTVILKRETAPEAPEKLPFPPTAENVDKLGEFIRKKFATSAFNITAAPLAKLSGPPMKIHLKPNAVPRACHKPINVPHHMRENTKNDIDRDVELGILEKVPTGVPTVWCSRMVVVPKPSGKVRRTVDLAALNNWCLRETHATEAPFFQVSRVKLDSWKTVMDAWNGYHAVELDESSRDLTTFITPWGKYRYRRAPQGYLASGDAYTRRTDDITEDLSTDTCKVIDDTLLYADSIEQQFYKTWTYLKRCADNGITFNVDKFQFCKREVNFAGFRVGEDCIKPSKEIIESIANFPTPLTISEARGWFGLVEQVAWSYIIKDTMVKFRHLTKEGNKKWDWNPDLEKEFEDSKAEIIRRVEDGVKSYDVNKRTCLATDWSKTGMGFLCLQKHCGCDLDMAPVCCKEGWKLVYAGSKKCSPAEGRYAPIEGECLAVAWSLEKARMFTLGCKDLLVSTDHKPLIAILGDRALEEISNGRLLRLKEKTLRFRFDIQHIPGIWNKGSDAFSRATLMALFDVGEDDDDMDDDIYITEVANIRAAVCVDPVDVIDKIGYVTLDEPVVTLEDIARSGKADPEYSALTEAIVGGFPEKKEECQPILAPFLKDSKRLTIVKEGNTEVVVFHDSEARQRIFVPRELRSRIKRNIHSDHRRDLVRVKQKAEQHVYWPNMGNELRSYIEQCNFCQVNRPSLQKEPLTQSPAPEYPFQHVAADYFEVAGHHYLVYVDRYSGWPEVAHFPPGHNTTGDLIKRVRQWFMDTGAPEEFSCDEGSTLVSGGFRQFLTDWGCKIRTSSARYAQSNGRAEAAVKQAKKIVTGNVDGNGSLNTDRFAQALMAYRNSMLYPETKKTISQSLLGRNLRDVQPALRNFYLLKKEMVLEKNQREETLRPRYEASERLYNRGARTLPPLEVGDRVRIQNITTVRERKWDKCGVIIEVLLYKKYRVKVDDTGRITVRNRRHLCKIPEDNSEPEVQPGPTRIPQRVGDLEDEDAVASDEDETASEGGEVSDTGEEVAEDVVPEEDTAPPEEVVRVDPPNPPEVRRSSRETAKRFLFQAEMGGKSHTAREIPMSYADAIKIGMMDTTGEKVGKKRCDV